MTDRLAEAASNEGWRPEADEPLSDRPGIVASLLRYRLLVALVTLLGAVAGYGVAQQTPLRYQSEASLILSDPGGPTFLGGDPLPSSDRAAYLAKQSSIMTSSIVLRRVVNRLGGGSSVGELRSRLQVRPSADMAGISIVATGPDSPSAASLANDVGIAYQDVAAERASRAAAGATRSIEKIRARRQAELDASPASPRGQLTAMQQLLSNQIVELDQREQDITEKLAFFGSGVELFERAERPASPTQPRPKLGALLGALLGLLVAGIWAWGAAARNQRTEGRGDPARILGAPLLGEVPELRAPWGLADGSSAPPVLGPGVADAYHVIVAALEHELAGVGGSSVAVTSVGLGDSRTVTTLSIATAASEAHRKVLLIDADERTRRLSELYSVHEVGTERDLQVMRLPPGDRRNAQEYVGRLVDTGSAFVLPITQNGTDPDQPARLSHVPDMSQALSSVGRLFDLVLIDTPAVLAASDTLRIAGQADGIVLLIPHRLLLRDLRAVRDRLAFVKTPLVGYVYVQPAGGVLERWTRGRPSQDARRQTETGKQGQHTMFPVRDKSESAPLVADMLGLAAPEARDQFLVVHVDDDVTLDFLDVDACEPIEFTFDVTDLEFDEIASRLTDRGIPFWADAEQERAQQIGSGRRGRVLFWEEPSGHLLEVRAGSLDETTDQDHAESTRRLVPEMPDRGADWAEGPGPLSSARRNKVLLSSAAVLRGVFRSTSSRSGSSDMQA